MKTKIVIWIVWKLPRFIIYWCGMRILAHATSKQWSSTIVPGLTVMEALDRWDKPHELRKHIEEPLWESVIKESNT